MLRKYIIAAMAALSVFSSMAQSRSLAIADMPASPGTIAFGGSALGAEGSIYADPALLPLDTTSTRVGYSYGLVDSDAGRMNLHTLTASQRMGQGVLMLGFRYYAQGRLERQLDIDMKPIGHGRRLYSYLVDAGYVRAVGPWMLYGEMGVGSEKTVTQATACRVGLGAALTGSCGAATWEGTLAVRDLGFVMTGNKSEALAPLAHGGGRFRMPTFAGQVLTLVVDGGAYLPLGDNSCKGTFGGGLAYGFAKRVEIRAGGHTGDGDDFVSAGLGVRMGRVHVDVGTKFGLASGLPNVYMIGASLAL